MQIEKVKKLDAFSRLTYWITERESIRLKKEQGLPKPWTDDVILQSFRFCNVIRMDDKVSRWLLDNWYRPYKNHKNIPFACCLARCFNLPESLEPVTRYVFGKLHPESIKKIMIERKASGKNVFNGAYIVSTNGLTVEHKSSLVMDRVVIPFITDPPGIDTTSMERTVAGLVTRWGISTFMAGQITADLRHAMDGTWEDSKKWAAIGPGSRRGMNRLLAQPIDSPMKQSEFDEELTLLMEQLQSNEQFLASGLAERIEAIDFQNCLCEFDKYERTLWDNRKPKQRYEGKV